MKSAQELKEKYEQDLRDLQESCPHEKTVWMREEWAPAHGTGFNIRGCSNCWKTIEKAPATWLPIGGQGPKT